MQLLVVVIGIPSSHFSSSELPTKLALRLVWGAYITIH